MSRPAQRAVARRELADQLERLAIRYDALAQHLASTRASARELASAIELALDLDRELARELEFILASERDRDSAFARVCASALDELARSPATSARARALARHLRVSASRSRAGGRQPPPPRREDRDEVRILSVLARLLPAPERARFVSEERGNLAGCEGWWERVDRLVCLALGMSRLAWQLRRGGGREQA